MRYSWIDGTYVEVDRCIHCPFFSYDGDDTRSECNYPDSELGTIYFYWPGAEVDVHSRCPLRIRQQV